MIQAIRKKIKKEKEERKYKIRDNKELKILKSFLYKGFKGDFLSIHIYDKITDKVYAGNLGISSYKESEVK